MGNNVLPSRAPAGGHALKYLGPGAFWEGLDGRRRIAKR
jgi:hypothetical protein